VLLTNLREFGSSTIAAIYKDRWEIELFFQALQQNLKVKTFVGTSENALRIQIWTALIAMLLLKWLHHLSKAKWSLSNLASMLRRNLFACFSKGIACSALLKGLRVAVTRLISPT
jgi:IS4 transposase